MSHQRQVIRDAVKAALVSRTMAGTNVFATRFIPLQTVQLPALTVYTLNEDVDPESINRTRGPSRELWRTAKMMIEGTVIASGTTDNPDDVMDTFAAQIEKAMNADETFGGVCDRSIMESTEIDVLEVGKKAVGVVALTYSVLYQTWAPDDADTNLNDFEGVKIDYQIPSSQEP